MIHISHTYITTGLGVNSLQITRKLHLKNYPHHLGRCRKIHSTCRQWRLVAAQMKAVEQKKDHLVFCFSALPLARSWFVCPTDAAAVGNDDDDDDNDNYDDDATFTDNTTSFQSSIMDYSTTAVQQTSRLTGPDWDYWGTPACALGNCWLSHTPSKWETVAAGVLGFQRHTTLRAELTTRFSAS